VSPLPAGAFLNYYRSTNEWVRKLIDIENQLAIEFLDCLQAFDREKFERYYTDSKDMFDTFTALKGLVREFDAIFSHSAVERELVASAVSDVMTYGIGKVGISLGKSPHFVPPSPEVHGIVQGVGCGLDKTLYELTGDEMTARGTIALKDDNDAIHTYPLQAIESLRLID